MDERAADVADRARLPEKPQPNEHGSIDQQQSIESSVKDTIESILVAFILAFIFRAFVVEAFVIPTGSMAPTLLGAHMRFRCPDCGYHFDVNFQGTDRGGDDIEIPAIAMGKSYNVFCPNCGFRLPQVSRGNADDPDSATSDPAVHYGDRILVLKYLYLFQDPQRWDVVVFKSPHDPKNYDYTQNYIKRLIGKPGEAVMVLDGDIYIGPEKSTDPGEFVVQTKPRHVQEALWRIVYDNDYRPRGLDRVDPRGDTEQAFVQPWKQPAGQTGWTVGDGSPGQRDFLFNNPTGSATLAFDPEANPRSYALTDWLAYDVNEFRGGSRDYEPENNVSDVKLSFYYQRHDGSGPFTVELKKLDELFQVEIAPDQVTLLMNGKPIAGPVSMPKTSSPIHVEVLNVDYRVSVNIDGKEMLATTPQQYRPNVKMLLDRFQKGIHLPKAQVGLVGDAQSSTVSHVSLWRDVYYRNSGGERVPTRRPLWASPVQFPENLMRLGKDEFFVMGDNSLVSLDARFWDEPIDLKKEGLIVQSGRVPQRFMLGKAFFVYWPAGYRPVDAAPALVPDFGDMRFIH